MLGIVGRVCVQSSKTKQTKPKGQLSVNTVNVKTNEQEKEKEKKRKKKKKKKKKEKAVSQSYSIREQNSLHNNLREIQGYNVLTEDNLDTGRRWSR